MESITEYKAPLVLNYDESQNVFLINLPGAEFQLPVYCNIKLQGDKGGVQRSVNTSLDVNDYKVLKFVNPYLNAQNDTFKIKINEKTVGYIIPLSAMEDDSYTHNFDFDEYLQAYKYYGIKSVLEEIDYKNIPKEGKVFFSNLVDKNTIFAVFYQPSIPVRELNFNDFLPSFALKGYYYFQNDVNPNIISLIEEYRNDGSLVSLIDSKFYTIRGNGSLNIHKANKFVENNPLINLLYNKLLAESGNPLHRFLILYQVIEYLVDKKIKEDIDQILSEKESLTNFKFVQKINEINNTRSIINKLFAEVKFDEKSEITSALRDFLQTFEHDYKHQETGDCFYDIRNLLFHDYKSVLQKNMNIEIVSLVIQCEILIHQVLISMGTDVKDLIFDEDLNVTLIEKNYSTKVVSVLEKIVSYLSRLF